MKKLRIAIIGCRNMGKKHLNILQEYFADAAEVVGILNSTPESSARQAAELGLAYFNSLADITSNKVDGVIIATPGITHAAVGSELLSRGIPCLVEKPLGTTKEECESLINAAVARKTTLFVGHLENYNPAVIRLKQELAHPIKSISGIRTSRNSGNKTGISAVQELMIHDLAIVYSLLGGKPSTVQISKRADLDWENHAVADFSYSDGAAVKLEALRDDVPIQRYMDIEDSVGNRFHIAFTERSLSKNGRELIAGGNTLVNELDNFLGCLRGEETPLVGGREAEEILGLCLRLEGKIPQLEQPAYLFNAQRQKSL